MGESTFRGKPLKDCTLEELHDALAWAEARISLLYDPNNRPIPSEDAQHLWDDMARQIQEELDARKSRPPPPEPKIMGEEDENLQDGLVETAAWLRREYPEAEAVAECILEAAQKIDSLRASLTRAEAEREDFALRWSNCAMRNAIALREIQLLAAAGLESGCVEGDDEYTLFTSIHRLSCEQQGTDLSRADGEKK